MLASAAQLKRRKYMTFYCLIKARGTFHLAAVVAARRVKVCGVYGVFRKH